MERRNKRKKKESNKQMQFIRWLRVHLGQPRSYCDTMNAHWQWNNSDTTYHRNKAVSFSNNFSFPSHPNTRTHTPIIVVLNLDQTNLHGHNLEWPTWTRMNKTRHLFEQILCNYSERQKKKHEPLNNLSS